MYHAARLITCVVLMSCEFTVPAMPKALATAALSNLTKKPTILVCESNQLHEEQKKIAPIVSVYLQHIQGLVGTVMNYLPAFLNIWIRNYDMPAIQGVSALAHLSDGNVALGKINTLVRYDSTMKLCMTQILDLKGSPVSAILEEPAGVTDKTRVWCTTYARMMLHEGDRFLVLGSKNDMRDSHKGFQFNGSHAWCIRSMQFGQDAFKKDVQDPIQCAIPDMALLRDGMVAVCSDRKPTKDIMVYDVKRKSIVCALKGHADQVFCLKTLPNGDLVSGSADRTIIVWDGTARKKKHVLKGHKESVKCLALLSDDHVVSGSSDGEIIVWDCSLARMVQRLKVYQSQVNALATFSDGTIIASSGNEGVVTVWNSFACPCTTHKETLPSRSGH